MLKRKKMQETKELKLNLNISASISHNYILLAEAKVNKIVNLNIK